MLNQLQQRKMTFRWLIQRGSVLICEVFNPVALSYSPVN